MHILFVGHEASRTGAPIILYHFLDWVRNNTDYVFDLFLLRGGDFETDYLALLKEEKVFNREKRRSGVANRMLAHYGFDQHLLKTNYSNYDIIYLNSVASLKHLESLKSLHPKAKIILHMHELDTVMNAVCGKELFEKSKHLVDQYIAVSEAVKDFLNKRCKIEEYKIEIVYEFVNRTELENLFNKEKGEETGEFIVGGSGTLNWRKGIDVFLQVAGACAKQGNVKFIWVGGNSESTAFFNTMRDIQLMNLEDTVQIIPSTPDRFQEYKKFDLFFLSSREDPFPLVCIENFYLGNPIMCFENSGGIPELVDKFGGVKVSYLDIQRAADEILSLANNPKELKSIASSYSLGVKDYDKVYASQKIHGIIDKVYNT